MVQTSHRPQGGPRHPGAEGGPGPLLIYGNNQHRRKPGLQLLNETWANECCKCVLPSPQAACRPCHAAQAEEPCRACLGLSFFSAIAASNTGDHSPTCPGCTAQLSNNKLSQSLQPHRHKLTLYTCVVSPLRKILQSINMNDTI